jgi:RNA polymerase sigma factor (sigma-70 family)
MVRYLKFFLSDQQVVSAIRNGNDKALTYLYERNLRMIRKFVLENSGTEPDSAELLQDALVVLWENVRSGKFTLQSKISTYLFSVAKNKWLQELGRKKRFSVIDEQQINQPDGENQEDNLLKQELIEIVKTYIEQLSPLCRKILLLFYYEDRSMTEISKILGLANENVAKSKKYQCKKDLEQLVKAHLNESGEIYG